MDYCVSCYLFGQYLHTLTVILAVKKARTATVIKSENGNLVHLNLDAVSDYLLCIHFHSEDKNSYVLKNNF